MSRRTRRVLLVGLVLALVVGAVLVGRAVLERSSRTSLDEALRMVPGASLRVSFTDWAAARRITEVARTTEAAEIERLVAAAYDEDLSATSVLTEAAAAQQEHLGFSPGTVQWEALAQSREGAALVLRLADEVDLDDVRAALEESGFQKPSSAGGVWDGGVDLLSSLKLGTQFQFVAVLDDQHTVVASDAEPYAAKAARIARGDGQSLAEADDTAGLTGSVTDPVVAAMLWSRDFACEDLALSGGSEEDAARGTAVIEEAGGVGPLSGLLMARLAGNTVVVVERYEDERRARADLEARAKLAVGEAVGRAGTFAEEFELASSRTDGANVVLRLRGREDNAFLLSSLHNGPVIFAAC